MTRRVSHEDLDALLVLYSAPPASKRAHAIYAADLALDLRDAHARIAALEAELAEARRDDTELDATDAAKPAWWRGYDYGVAEICLAAFKAITGEEAKTPVTWKVLKETIAARGAK